VQQVSDVENIAEFTDSEDLCDLAMNMNIIVRVKVPDARSEEEGGC
jgi:hypothetical protein